MIHFQYNAWGTQKTYFALNAIRSFGISLFPMCSRLESIKYQMDEWHTVYDIFVKRKENAEDKNFNRSFYKFNKTLHQLSVCNRSIFFLF